jgi:hypothetical protein
MIGLMRTSPGPQPLPQPPPKIRVPEILAPERGIFDSGLVSDPLRLSMPTNPGQVPDQLADGEDRSAMGGQPGRT